MKTYRIEYTENTDSGWPCQYAIQVNGESVDAVTCAFDRHYPLAWDVTIVEAVE